MPGGWKATGQPSSDQGETWKEMGRKLSATRLVWGSDTPERAREDYATGLNDTVGGIGVPAGPSGVVFAFGGPIAEMRGVPRRIS